MEPAIHAFAREPQTPEAIERFLAGREFPLVEGTSATFVYRGEAEAVFLRHMIFGLPSRQPLERLGDSDLWYAVLDLPESSRVEYKFEVMRNGASTLSEDPLNPHRSRDPFGLNSVAHGRGYVTPEWTRPDPEARPGTLEERRFASPALGREARVTLYLPARFRRTRRYPLLIVHDGGDFLNYAGIQTVLDNLIHRLEMAETVVALLHPGERLVEYADHEPHARFVAEELTPMLEDEFPLLGEPAARCLLGASFGAVASLSTAWRYPGHYGRLLLLSGSFAFTDIGPSPRGPMFAPVVSFVNAFRSRPAAVAERVFISCGTYEPLIYENRSLLPFLQGAGMKVRWVEARDGHNWENWRDRLRDGLSWLLPGPLWMVYE
ncbi:MAG TPA: alpha/beta hydrolase-fold protein [Candidatus Limnocylindria bacterium]|nr:alpha/beta hydrolase-fold protein [Candidatus Limnocylindria bacterium]